MSDIGHHPDPTEDWLVNASHEEFWKLVARLRIYHGPPIVDKA